jgi:hypothetical protein
MVPISNNHLKNTSGGAFTKQTYGGAIIGTTATPIITKTFLVKDVNPAYDPIYTGPKELSGAKTYNTTKILSGASFAYNAAKQRSWVISRVSTSLAGIANAFLQAMGSVVPDTSFPYYLARNYIDNTTLVRKGQFSMTGYDSTGAKIKKRTTWVTNPTGTAGADYGTSSQVPTRAVPGELVILSNFTDYTVATSSNYYKYPPITGK